MAKGIKPKIVQDLWENVEGLEHLWLDGTMLRGAASETKAVVMKRLYNAIMTKVRRNQSEREWCSCDA